MARPQTDGGVDSHSPGQHQSCRMEVLRPDAWPSGGIPSPQQPYVRHRGAGSISVPLPHPQRDAFTPPSENNQDNLTRNSTGTAGEHSGPRESQSQSDPLAQRSSSSGESSEHRAPAQENAAQPEKQEEAEEEEEEVTERAVALQLRTIGDEINAVFLQRRNGALQWQGWRGLWRGLFTFITDTLSTLYQHRLR